MYHLGEIKPFSQAQNFWEEIIEAFELIELDLMDIQYETRQEAIDKAYKKSLAPDDLRLDSLFVHRYRETDDRENIKRFHDLGRNLLPVIQKHIDTRQVTPAFLFDWGQLTFCHGVVIVGVLARGDDLQSRRAGQKGGEIVSKGNKRIWFSHYYMHEYKHYPFDSKKHFKRERRLQIEERICKLIVDIVEDKKGSGEKYPSITVGDDWFSDFLTAGNELKPAYHSRTLSFKKMRDDYSQRSTDGLPPLNLKIPTP